MSASSGIYKELPIGHRRVVKPGEAFTSHICNLTMFNPTFLQEEFVPILINSGHQDRPKTKNNSSIANVNHQRVMVISGFAGGIVSYDIFAVWYLL